MRKLRDWLIGTLGTTVMLLAVASVALLAMGAALTWANKHSLVSAAYVSAAVAAAPVVTKLGRSTSKSTLSQLQQRHKARKLLLVSPGQQYKPLRVAAVNPAHLRIHPAGVTTGASALTPVPYVKRDLHDTLAELIAAGSFVLLQGGSAVGKSRLAFEAARSAVPQWKMVVPEPPTTTPGALASLADLAPTRTLVWLDDLQRYLTPDGLTERVLDRLVSPQRGVSVLATLNSGAKAALGRSDAVSIDRTLRAEALRIVERAEYTGVFYIDAQLTATELDRANAAEDGDKRIADATAHNADDGFGPRLAGGPAALARWRDSRNGGNRIGAAIIDAAVNLRLAGYTAPIPAPMLLTLSREHLSARHRLFNDQVFRDALTWSCDSERDTRPCLEQVEPDRFEVFDYLTDHAQRYPESAVPIPPALWQTAIAEATIRQCFTIGAAAYNRKLLDVAEQAFNKAASANDAQALAGLAFVVSLDSARREEAEQLFRRAIDAGNKHAIILLAALVGSDPARLGESEPVFRRAIDIGDNEALYGLALLLARTLDPAHRDEAEQLYRRAIDTGNKDALSGLAVLLGPERLEEIEPLFRRAIDTGDTRALYGLAVALSKVPARRDEAESLFRRAIDTGDTRALYGLAVALSKDPARRDEAEQLYRRAIDSGNTHALYRLAALLVSEPRTRGQAREFYLRAREAGIVDDPAGLAAIFSE